MTYRIYYWCIEDGLPWAFDTGAGTPRVAVTYVDMNERKTLWRTDPSADVNKEPRAWVEVHNAEVVLMAGCACFHDAPRQWNDIEP